VKLPENSVGISDLLDHRECPRRMSWKMRRHVARGQQSERSTPEAAVHGAVWSRDYGSAVHLLFALVEDGFSDERALQLTWNEHGRGLDPEDLDLLRDDLAAYRRRDFANMRTVALEDDLRVPLFVYRGEVIYFRFRLDRLYERLDAPGTYVHIDYKSSKWPRSREEVNADKQLWAYNWAIHELLPEVETLVQVYDQLRHGRELTRKSDDQRSQIREWLIAETTSVLENESWQQDGLLDYSYNEWCAYCPIMESCGVVLDLSDFALTRIEALSRDLDGVAVDEYLEDFEKAKGAKRVLERFIESVNDMARRMPQHKRERLGVRLASRSRTVFTPEAAMALHDRVGERFYELVRITQAGVRSGLADDPALRDWALGLAERQAGNANAALDREAA
jgi:hypothetical protein